MENFLGFEIGQYVTPERVSGLVRIGVLLVIGLPCLYLFQRWIRSLIATQYSVHRGVVVSKLAFYLGAAIIAVSMLYELGFSLTPLLGAAGIVGIALGFASQTSVSNIISGLFLITEEPFLIGDVIVLGDARGQVHSIDLLSIKLRTFDNRFIRIPNETIIKSQVTNITRFPIRRLDVEVAIAYKEDAGRVRDVLLEVAHNNPLALEEPEPLVIFSGFGSSSIDLIFAVWVTKEDYLKLKNSIQEEIKREFDKEGIEIPFPHLSLYTGSATEPFPVQVVSKEKQRE